MRANPVSGLQAAQVGLAAQLRAYAEQFGPRDYAELLELHARLVDAERRRIGRGSGEKG